MSTSGGSSGGGGPLTTVESYISSNVTLTSGTNINITSVSLAAGTWLVMARANIIGNAATISAVDVAIGPTTASFTGAYAIGTGEVGDVAGAAEFQQIAIMKSVTLASTTTVYLNGLSGGATATALAGGNTSGTTNATGITAVKTA